jgi:hypothetical protein
MRRNAPMTLEKYDPRDPLLVEEAAVGAHGNYSVISILRG